MAIWQGHLSRPSPRCAIAWPARARERWPQLAGITVRYHGEFAYVAGQLPDGTALPLCRLRYAGSASSRGGAGGHGRSFHDPEYTQNDPGHSGDG